MKEKFRIQQMVLTALFIAIVVVMTLTPLGYIRVNFIDMTTIHVVMILGAVFLGIKGGLVVGAAWGLSNWALAMFRGTPEVLWFMNPLISVLPRVLAGLLTALYFIFISRVLFKKTNLSYSITVLVTAVLATLTHTALVIVSVMLFSGQLSQALNIFFSAAVMVNMVFEIIFAAIIVPAVAFPLYNMVNRQLDYSNTKLKARKEKRNQTENAE